MMYSGIILIAIAIALVWFFTNNGKGTQFFGSEKKEDPIDILKRRFAQGEIDEKEYEERKATLKKVDHVKY